MKDLTDLDRFRRRTRKVLELYGWYGDKGSGVFDIPSAATGVTLQCVASSGEGWDHVSVSLSHRTPNWREMELVKRAFFQPDETAMQLHVPLADHINLAATCLHLWRPNDGREIPRPPGELVA